MTGTKVLVFSHAAGSDLHGPNTRWYSIARAAKSLGVETLIVGSAKFHKYTTHPPATFPWSCGEVNGVEFKWLWAPSYSGRVGQVANQVVFTLLACLFACNLVLRKNRKDLSVVVASSPHPFVIFPAYIVSRIARIPLLFDVRDLWPKVIMDLTGVSKRNPYMRLLKGAESFAVRKSACVMSVKPGDIEYFEAAYGLKAHRFKYLPNGYLPPPMSPSPNQGRDSRTNLPFKTRGNPSDFVVGYVGAMSSYYELEPLLEAARLLRDDGSIKFVLVGGGEDLEGLKSFVRNLELKNVTFEGKVDRSKVIRYIQSFDVCYVGLKPANANRFGISCNKIYEYMFCGKPILGLFSTKYDPIKQGGAGVTIPNGIDAPSKLAALILAWRGDPVLLAEMGQRSRAAFEECFDVTHTSRQFLQIIRSAMEVGNA